MAGPGCINVPVGGAPHLTIIEECKGDHRRKLFRIEKVKLPVLIGKFICRIPDEATRRIILPRSG